MGGQNIPSFDQPNEETLKITTHDRIIGFDGLGAQSRRSGAHRGTAHAAHPLMQLTDAGGLRSAANDRCLSPSPVFWQED
jgi:hypothetical protein